MMIEILAAEQALDLWSTYQVIRFGGIEMSPVLLKLDAFLHRFTKAKWAWLVVAKVSIVALFWVLDEQGAFESVRNQQVLLGLVVLYGGLFVNNAVAYFKQRRINGG